MKDQEKERVFSLRRRNGRGDKNEGREWTAGNVRKSELRKDVLRERVRPV